MRALKRRQFLPIPNQTECVYTPSWSVAFSRPDTRIQPCVDFMFQPSNGAEAEGYLLRKRSIRHLHVD
jgi:hypothetical protein